MSFCVFNDLTAEKDQKTPGTFFEAFIGHFFSLTFGVKPRKKVEVLTVEDERSTLKTDYIFDLGPGRLKFHVPVKTSTRERAIQVWTHQHMLNGVYGGGRFRGMLVALAETKVNLKTLEVTEICLPAQWAVYQRFVARMDRIYYLDIPEKYAALATKFPYISVKTLGEFFVEKDTLRDPALMPFDDSAGNGPCVSSGTLPGQVEVLVLVPESTAARLPLSPQPISCRNPSPAPKCAASRRA